MEYTIGQVARMTGLSVDTLRYYDKEGLLFFVEHKANGRRVFKESDFDWLNELLIMKKAGVPLKDIKSYLDWYRDGDETFEKRIALFREQRREMEDRLAQIQEYIDVLDFKIAHYERRRASGDFEWKQPGSCMAEMNEYLSRSTDRRRSAQER